MNYKLICLDVDGTLLDDEKRVSEAVKESLAKVHAIGISVALVTGRMPAATERIEKEVSVPCIKACNAGTYILLGEECIHAKVLPVEAAQKINEEFFAPHHLPLWVFEGKKWYVTAVDSYVERESRIIHVKPEIVKMDELVKRWKEDGGGPNKLLAGADPSIISEVNPSFSASMQISNPSP